MGLYSDMSLRQSLKRQAKQLGYELVPIEQKPAA
jgi:hypothetical protein